MRGRTDNEEGDVENAGWVRISRPGNLGRKMRIPKGGVRDKKGKGKKAIGIGSLKSRVPRW